MKKANDRLTIILVLVFIIILVFTLITLFPYLRLGGLYILLFICSPYYLLFVFVLFSFEDLASFFVNNFIPTVYCEGLEDPFSMVKQFSDLSSLNTQNMIREGYSGVSGIYMFQCTETGGIYIGSSVDLYKRFYAHGPAGQDIHYE